MKDIQEKVTHSLLESCIQRIGSIYDWSVNKDHIVQDRPYLTWSYWRGRDWFKVMCFKEASDIGHSKYEGRRVGEWYDPEDGRRPAVQPRAWKEISGEDYNE